jgi:hypothetical protein
VTDLAEKKLSFGIRRRLETITDVVGKRGKVAANCNDLQGHSLPYARKATGLGIP